MFNDLFLELGLGLLQWYSRDFNFLHPGSQATSRIAMPPHAFVPRIAVAEMTVDPPNKRASRKRGNRVRMTAIANQSVAAGKTAKIHNWNRSMMIVCTGRLVGADLLMLINTLTPIS